MNRRDRRYGDGPHFALERVRACIRLGQFKFTRTAFRDAQRVLPPGTVAVDTAIREIVLDLDVDQWKFAQEKDGGWVDVYRVAQEEGVDLWVKLKVELTPQTKEYTVVVSFHEWDDSRPI
jgi:hypothetical protein